MAGFLAVLAGCRSDKAPAAPGPQYVMLTYNGGNCQQNGGTGLVDIDPNQAVVYQGASTLSQFQIQLSSCPFASCPVNSPNGTSQNIGTPKPSAAGNTYYYSGMTIDNEKCTDMGTMGVRIKNP